MLFHYTCIVLLNIIRRHVNLNQLNSSGGCELRWADCELNWTQFNAKNHDKRIVDAIYNSFIPVSQLDEQWARY